MSGFFYSMAVPMFSYNIKVILQNLCETIPHAPMLDSEEESNKPSDSKSLK